MQQDIVLFHGSQQLPGIREFGFKVRGFPNFKDIILRVKPASFRIAIKRWPISNKCFPFNIFILFHFQEFYT
jgi:hypothetical protein